MTALKDYPVIFNDGADTLIFQWDKWEENYSKVQTSNVSEAGTDLISITRTGKLSVSCEYACTSSWLATFQNFSELPSFTLKKYDAVEAGYKSFTVRMENFKVSTERHSDYITESTGLYIVTFDLIEF